MGSLTGWGMREVESIPEVMKGSVMHRLFQRAFPGFFPYNSLHLWQPFHIPAMNYVLANVQTRSHDEKAFDNQKLSEDLEKLCEMGLTKEIVSKIDTIFETFGADATLSNPRVEEFLNKWTDTLQNLEKNNGVGYTKLEILQIKEAMNRKEDIEFVRLQLMFKALKRAIRMPDSKFSSHKTTVVHVKSYDDIVEKIIAMPHIFKNPGYLDSRSIPDGPLRAILAGNLDENLGRVLKNATSMLRKMIDQRKEDYFMKYFGEKTKEFLTAKGREYQKIDVPGKGGKAQVYQIDIVSEYVYVSNILLRLCLRTFTDN